MTNNRRIGVLSRVALLLATLSVTACMATVGADMMSIPPDSAQRCDGHCRSIGLSLGAVAIMANNVGCVCQVAAPPRASGLSAGETSTPVAGMATVLMQHVAAQQQQQRHHAAK
jgi:hypothetical protein